MTFHSAGCLKFSFPEKLFSDLKEKEAESIIETASFFISS